MWSLILLVLSLIWEEEWSLCAIVGRKQAIGFKEIFCYVLLLKYFNGKIWMSLKQIWDDTFWFPSGHFVVRVLSLDLGIWCRNAGIQWKPKSWPFTCEHLFDLLSLRISTCYGFRCCVFREFLCVPMYTSLRLYVFLVLFLCFFVLLFICFLYPNSSLFVCILFSYF